MTSLSKIIKSVNAIEDGRTVTLCDVDILTSNLKTDDADPAENHKQGNLDIDVQITQIKTVSESILNRTRADADNLMSQTMDMLSTQREAMLCEVNEQAEQIRKQAYDEGRAAGMLDGLHSFDEELSQIRAAVAQLQVKQKEQIAALEEPIIQIALDVAEKILNKRITQDETEMESLVRAAIAADKGKSRITVELSKQMPVLIASLQQKLDSLKCSNCDAMELKAADLPVGACRIESEDGIIDASIWAQLENLKAQLENIDS